MPHDPWPRRLVVLGLLVLGVGAIGFFVGFALVFSVPGNPEQLSRMSEAQVYAIEHIAPLLFFAGPPLGLVGFVLFVIGRVRGEERT